MIKYILWIILFFGKIISYAQNTTPIVIESYIVDSISNTPLSYVNIGITNKNIGTVSGFDGKFSLTLPDTLSNENITFSMIGYSNKVLGVKELQNSNDTIFLSPKTIELDAAEIISNKLKTKKKGSSSGIGSALALNRLGLGGEVGTIIKLSHKEKALLKDFNFKITTNNPDSAIFRLNIYYIENDTFVNILDNNIYFTLQKGIKGDISIDLMPYQIVVDKDIFVSIELLVIYAPDIKFDKNDINRFFYDRINVSAKPMGSSYMRNTSHGQWSKVSVSPCFWLTVLY